MHVNARMPVVASEKYRMQKRRLARPSLRRVMHKVHGEIRIFAARVFERSVGVRHVKGVNWVYF